MVKFHNRVIKSLCESLFVSYLFVGSWAFCYWICLLSLGGFFYATLTSNLVCSYWNVTIKKFGGVKHLAKYAIRNSRICGAAPKRWQQWDVGVAVETSEITKGLGETGLIRKKSTKVSASPTPYPDWQIWSCWFGVFAEVNRGVVKLCH